MKGYVCYIDILGMSYFTSNKDKYGNPYDVADFIKKFHCIICDNINGSNIKHVVLSDSVFLYIESLENKILEKDAGKELLEYFCTIAKIFRGLIKNGILIRAGCSFGEYEITKTNLNEKNIHGEAVTSAVKLEETGKGSRIFIDKNIYEKIELINEIPYLFKKCIDKNYEEIYWFQWLVILDDYISLNSYDLNNKHNLESIKKVLEENTEISNLLNSLTYNHSKSTPEGKKHIEVFQKHIEEINNYLIEKIKNLKNIKYDSPTELSTNLHKYNTKSNF